VFRGKYLAALQRAFTTGQLVFAGSVAGLADPTAFAAWLAALRQHAWVVYAKRPFGGPTQVLEYLGRYTHRVALSNERLVRHADGVVHFRWKDYADGARVKVMALAAEEFIRRFLLHIVPGGFVRIRHFGFLANRTRRAKLARCRALLDTSPAPPTSPSESVAALMLRLTGLDIALSRLPAGAAPHHRNPRSGFAAHASPPARGHLVIAPAPTPRLCLIPRRDPALPVCCAAEGGRVLHSSGASRRRVPAIRGRHLLQVATSIVLKPLPLDARRL
jgi:hypothetical protein